MRSRPKVSLYYSEKVATAGRPFTIELALVGKTVTPVDFIETKLVGTESVTVGEGKGQYSRSIEVLRWSAREAPGVIEPREYRYRYTFEIPEAASASYRGTRAWVTYAMSVHVSVPWWPDRSAQYTLPVVVPDAAAPEDRPVIRASADGPQPGKVYAEVSIDHDVLGPGGIIAGAVSVSNTAAHRVRRVVASLVARETIHSPELVSYVVDRHTVILVDGAPGEGFDFQVQMQADQPGLLHRWRRLEGDAEIFVLDLRNGGCGRGVQKARDADSVHGSSGKG